MIFEPFELYMRRNILFQGPLNKLLLEFIPLFVLIPEYYPQSIEHALSMIAKRDITPNYRVSYESIALHCVLLHVRHERIVGQFISTWHYPGLLTAFKRLFVQ